MGFATLLKVFRYSLSFGFVLLNKMIFCPANFSAIYFASSSDCVAYEGVTLLALGLPRRILLFVNEGATMLILFSFANFSTASNFLTCKGPIIKSISLS